MHELVIRGGTVVDGTGAPARTADVAVDEGRITGRRHGGRARRAGSSTPTAWSSRPGWVDIHTHYDGQVTWDPDVTPVELARRDHRRDGQLRGRLRTGAPRRRGLPHRADGRAWRTSRARRCTRASTGTWESFPEYLDALDQTPRAIEIAAQVPHAALRAYVMGERAHERDANADEIAGDVDARRGGAARRCLRREHQPHDPAPLEVHGLVPGTDAPPEELLALGDAIGRAGHGVFQLVSDHQGGAGDRAWLVDLVERTGRDRDLHAGPGRLRAGRLARGARGDGRGPGRRPQHHPAGVVPADRDALRPAVVAAPLLHPPHLPRRSRTCRWPSGWPGSRSPTCGPLCSPRSPAPRTRSVSASCSGGSRSSRSATRRTTSRRARPAWPASPSARAGHRRRSSSTGCSNETARRSCSLRSPATRITTTRRCAR